MADRASIPVDNLERLFCSLVVLFDGTVGLASEGVRGGLSRGADHVFGMFTPTLTPPLNITHARGFVQAQSASQRLL